ncbi:TadE/TadG family type IV pilus assembly protein [Hyalangium versicolor]|uniref:TadE/TadG family type IV pilus assembly protein n=1 Tax=Hyalangium versicolor TaxID=2861190 RepID=UPI001CCD47E9|nr:TadE/TadG family type IV pilus assembly protein [Hyalangium versicolor]
MADTSIQNAGGQGPRCAGQSGQAAVEAALTLPLTVFLILGLLQLFLMMQARIMAEYAAFRATRAGSVRHGDCEAMTHAAILALLPTFHSYLGSGLSGSPADKLGQAFGLRKGNAYTPGWDGNHNGSIVWIVRESPQGFAAREDKDFDEPRSAEQNDAMRLETRLVFWFPLKVPFANWVISRMMLSYWGYKNDTAQDPLMLARKTRWKASTVNTMTLETAVQGELLHRVASAQYVIPIHASASLRMMTPAQGRYFLTQNCPPAPETL